MPVDIVLHPLYRSDVFPVVRIITSQIEYKPVRGVKLDRNCCEGGKKGEVKKA
jgi:hypothetical protein